MLKHAFPMGERDPGRAPFRPPRSHRERLTKIPQKPTRAWEVLTWRSPAGRDMNHGLTERITGLGQTAIALLRREEPRDKPYYLAFSGGKDSCVIKHLAEVAGVRYEAWYHSTTIDPPELVRFLKEEHRDVRWVLPKQGAMMARVARKPGLPPTRSMRWCCAEYKEHRSPGRTKIFGVRQAESATRKKWNEVSVDSMNDRAVCPIVYWSDEDVWGYIYANGIKYCTLYDEGWNKLGCVGCPLADKKNQKREFERWPKFKENWRRAIVKNWENFHDKLRRDGKPYYHAKFKSGEDLWQWWLTAKRPDYFREDCQTGLMMTNELKPSEEREEDQEQSAGL